MKLLSYHHEGNPGWGALTQDGQGVVDLGRCLPDLPSVLALLQAGPAALERARQACHNAAADFQLSQLSLDLPVSAPPRIFCIGVNYAHRNAEYKDGSELPRYPSIFMRVPDSFTGHGTALLQPAESQQLDYEGEIVLVIGKEGRIINAIRQILKAAGGKTTRRFKIDLVS